MIFTFPALASEKVDKQLLPAICKTLEHYYLIHLVTAIAAGYIRFRVELKKDGKVKDIIVEQVSGAPEGSLDFLSEGGLPWPQSSPQAPYSPPPTWAAGLPDEEEEEPIEKEEEAEKEPEEKEPEEKKPEGTYDPKWSSSSKPEPPKRSPTGTPGGEVKIDTFDKIGLFPTMVYMEVEIQRKAKGGELKKGMESPHERGPDWTPATSSWGQSDKRDVFEKRVMPIGVRVIPEILKNAQFDQLYNVLRNDYYSNIIVSVYKALIRKFLKIIWSTKTLQLIQRAFTRIVSSYKATGGWRGQILWAPGAFQDMSAFTKRGQSARTARYTASTLIMTRDENEDLFADGNMAKADKLFKLGWKSMAIVDPINSYLIFCSHLDQGLCSTIPYRYLFNTLRANDIYKDIQELEKMTGGMFRRSGLKRLSSIIKTVPPGFSSRLKRVK